MSIQPVTTLTDIEDVKTLIRRQDELEHEIRRLKDSLDSIKGENKKNIERVHRRIDRLEDEVAQIRLSIEKITSSIDLIQSTVTNVSEKIGEMNSKQDYTIKTQSQFIGQLWKAFFAVLGLVTAGGAALIAYFGK